MVAFVHTLSIERATTAAVDDYNQPVPDFASIAETPGLIQPKSTREVELASQAGAAIGDHTIYLARRDVDTADRIRDVTAGVDGPLYQVLGVRDYNFGGLAHLALDAQRIGAPAIEAGS